MSIARERARNRTLSKYVKTAAMAAGAAVGDNPLFLMDYVLRFLRVALLLSLWRMLMTGRGNVSGFTLSSVLTYTLIAEVFAEQLNAHAHLQDAFWNGSIATRFLKPLGIFSQFAAEMFGRWGFRFAAFSLPLLLCAPLLGVNPLPASFQSGLLFVPSLALGIGVGLAMELIAAALAVGWGLHVYAVDRSRQALSTLLSGSFLPLALYPWGIGKLFAWLPFAAMASAPLRIYTGTGNAFQLMAMQAGWCVLLWPAAQRLWAINRERMVSYGG